MRRKLRLTSLLAFALLFAVCAPAWGQAGTITGTVTDSVSGEPLPGVNVEIVGTQLGSATGANGTYTITDLEPGTYDLQASFVGYETKTIEGVSVEAGETAVIDVQLAESALQLDEVVAVAYGQQEAQSVTGSVSNLDMDAVDTQPLNSADQALQGQMAGVRVQSASGIPGGGPNITVRGAGNVGAGGQPLYVVDGFALPQTGQGSLSRRNPLSEISPNDIEDITVLKGASASALYGSRASNGVVLIETKSGRAGTFDFNVSASTGWNQTWDQDFPEPASARQFAEFQNFIWSDRVEQGAADEIPEEYRNPNQYGAGTNWWDAVSRTARRNEVNVSASGGNEQIQSYFSGGVTSDEGLLRNHDFTRVSGRANVQANVTENLSTDLRIAPTFTEQNLNWNGTGRDGPGGAPWMLCPLESVNNEDGSYNTQPGTECTGVWSHPNPVKWLQQEKNVDEALRLVSSASAEYELPLPGLLVRSQFNVDFRNETTEFFNPSTIGGVNSPPPSTPTGGEGNQRYLNWLSETTLNYQQSGIGPGDIDAVAGFTAQKQTQQGSFFAGQFPNDDIQTLNVASQLYGGSNEEEWSLLSGLGRINYTLLDKYVLTGSFRADGSSRFGADKRWGYFPSGAVAWNIHEEPFMDGVSDVSELRFRGSYGVTGNNQIGNYSSLGVVGDTEYVLGGNSASGRTLNSMPNSRLSWERTVEWNVGIDATLYDQVELEVNLYQRNTTDLLINRELPMTTGFGGVTQNTGELQNRGIEVSMRTTNVERENFRWTSNVNFTLNRNEITSLPGGEDIRYTAWPAEYLHREGQPMGSYVGFVFDGLYTSEEEVENHEASFPGSVPGTMRWRDLNGDGVMTEDVMQPDGDYAILGDANPDFSFSFNNSVRVGDFDVRATITGEFGSTNLRTEWITTYRNIDGLFNVDAEYVENFWRSRENPGDGLTPTPIGGATPRQQYRDTQHSIFLWDASHIWLRDLSVRYNLNGALTGLQGTSVYVSASNLLVVTPYPSNPDATDLGDPSENQGRDDGNYPVPQTLTVGIDFSF